MSDDVEEFKGLIVGQKLVDEAIERLITEALDNPDLAEVNRTKITRAKEVLNKNPDNIADALRELDVSIQ